MRSSNSSGAKPWRSVFSLTTVASDELQQVVGPAGLQPATREPAATEGLAAHDRAGRGAVDVDVAARRAGDHPMTFPGSD